ncbi:MAG TPA: hypothetical protein ENJ35_01535 [Gammaproteobacteria bacterium]|nr:hypothetical protein [Gammaproteobacteria bacterium]
MKGVSKTASALCLGLLAHISVANSALVALQNGTGTFSQADGSGGTFSPAQAVDGDLSDPNGWAIIDSGGNTNNQTAAWETAVDLAAGDLTFNMKFLHFNPGHLIGRFRLSVTTDSRDSFADGLDINGDVTANWSVLSSPTVTGPAGMTFSTLPDNSILAGGTTAAQGEYTINYTTNISSITGIRLEVLEDPSLPFNGPGLHANNGNFLLTEMTLDAAAVVPIPGAALLFGSGILGLFGCCGRRRKGKARH